MASYARTQQQHVSPEKSQLSILAQAKPAIISAPENNNHCNNLHLHNISSSNNYEDFSTGVLSEKINSTLRFSASTLQERENCKFNYNQKVKHIEDDSVIQKQNASNQMRQAAVMAAVASQQKVRLSATERLALTAKRPMTNPQLHPKPHITSNSTIPNNFNNSTTTTTTNNNPTNNGSNINNNHTTNTVAPPAPSTKPILAPLPTLETLLAVQRQLQQHTKQNLTSMPQQVVNNGSSNINNNDRYQFSQVSAQTINRHRNKPLPPSPPKSPTLSQQKMASYVTSVETYDKDLPPLPSSISTCLSSDDSQMNSLDSHQSSPATSLVSIPPPPPPISSYLQQYDEVNSCQHSIHSNSSTPSLTSSSDMSSVKQFPPLQVKSHHTAPSHQSSYFELPAAYQDKQHRSPIQSSMKISSSESRPPVQAHKPLPPPLPPQLKAAQKPQDLNGCGTINRQNPPHQQDSASATQQASGRIQPTQVQSSCQSQVAVSKPVVQPTQTQAQAQYIPYNSSLKYQEHLFNPTNCDSTSFQTLPPPPQLPSTFSTTDNVCTGFDEPDFRFPTPPPPDLLLADDDNDDDDDDDFQCRIPTPPPHKSMSSASFQDFHCHQQKQTPSPQFDSPTFCTTAHANGLQPPPLFRQQPQVASNSSSSARPAPSPPQLTVRINNEGGLLSTAPTTNNSIHPTVNVHHHHMMMATMATSSSSPSSSSDGDGQSSNSSSSTSGIHSSIDSPSSSNSKLDDFNYGGKLEVLGRKKHALNELRKSGGGGSINSNGSSISQSSSTSGATKCAAVTGGCGNSSTTSLAANNATIRPALKQKKSVSFSDKVEMVACAEEQSEDHLPNPLLARVLAGKLQ